jgi:catechol 2,3-dioxygenase-like lactoylglutathione lyase family enzyme
VLLDGAVAGRLEGSTEMTRPTGVSHVAMVTADLESWRAFYEDIIGLDIALVLAPSPDLGRHAICFAGDAVLHVFEIAGFDPAAHGIGTTMFERGRLDHLGFAVADEAALSVVRDRLVAACASSGEIRPLGPVLSVRYEDPDGLEGEINCFNPDFDPSTFGDVDEIVDPHWLERAKRALRSREAPIIPDDPTQQEGNSS